MWEPQKLEPSNMPDRSSPRLCGVRCKFDSTGTWWIVTRQLMQAWQSQHSSQLRKRFEGMS